MPPSARGIRADELLLIQGKAETRSKARALILAGDVRIGDRVIMKAGELVAPTLALEVRSPPPYVGRGGLKLSHALDRFALDVSDATAADIGASTGGFTDALLQRGVRRVYAIDVGYGQLDPRIRADTRVVVMERVNARFLEALPEPIDLGVIDVSFISLALILPAMTRILRPDGQVMALIKPQFEAGREAVGRGGIVRDVAVRRRTVEKVCQSAEEIGFGLRGLTVSPITGQSGNVEYLAWFTRDASTTADRSAMIDSLFRDDSEAPKGD